jgi:replication factor A1
MTTQEIIQAILAKHPEVTPEQIKENLIEEQNRSGGLLGDETLLRLIAAKYGVEVALQQTVYSGVLSSSRLFAGLNDVTVEGRLIAIFPVRSFNGGEKSGKFATLMIVDDDGILRVVLWNEKADLVEMGELKAGQVVRLVHGYTREDRYGKVELHLGGKSKIEINAEGKSVYPSVEKFATKISELTSTYRSVHLAGKVKEAFGLTAFTKGDGSDGKVLRFSLADSSGVATVVAWNEKAEELEKALKPNVGLHLVNAKVKETQSGSLEVQLDSGSFIEVLPVALLVTKMADLKEGAIVNVEGDVCAVEALREVTTGKGERIKLLVFELQDDSGTVRVSVWRNQAEELSELKMGDRVTVVSGYVKRGYGNKVELSTRSSTAIKIKKT